MNSSKHLTLIYNASQLLTLAGGPQRGSMLGSLGIIKNGAVLIQGSQILEIGASDELLEKYQHANLIDAQCKVVMPGFVDPHTHLVWAGDRAEEFSLRLAGKSYMEILESGGGILSTVTATRAASKDELVNQTKPRLWQAFTHGTTTAEVKTGYGLDFETEMKQIQAVLELDYTGPIDLVPTFLPAHAFPTKYKNKPEKYVELICQEMLPNFLVWWQEYADKQSLPFVDVFCEKGAFSLDQSRQILESAHSLGFPLKIHADEFENLGGAALAAELGAASADHLVKTSPEDIHKIAASDTVAVSLPGTPFGLAEDEYTPAKKILQANGLLALASDTNPGTSWCESMQFIIALACRYMRLTPAQAIAASTINAAAAINQAHLVGSLERGKQADVLILSINDYQMLGYRFGTNLVSKVIKKGRLYPVDPPGTDAYFMMGTGER